MPQKGSIFAPCLREISTGEVAEWSNAAVLKTVDCYRSGGSNPSLSALNAPFRGIFCLGNLCAKRTSEINRKSTVRRRSGALSLPHTKGSRPKGAFPHFWG